MTELGKHGMTLFLALALGFVATLRYTENASQASINQTEMRYRQALAEDRKLSEEIDRLEARIIAKRDSVTEVQQLRIKVEALGNQVETLKTRVDYLTARKLEQPKP